MISEAGENPALCLSNRDIYERTVCHWERSWEGVQVGLMIQSVDLPQLWTSRSSEVRLRRFLFRIEKLRAPGSGCIFQYQECLPDWPTIETAFSSADAAPHQCFPHMVLHLLSLFRDRRLSVIHTKIFSIHYFYAFRAGF